MMLYIARLLRGKQILQWNISCATSTCSKRRTSIQCQDVENCLTFVLLGRTREAGGPRLPTLMPALAELTVSLVGEVAPASCAKSAAEAVYHQCIAPHLAEMKGCHPLISAAPPSHIEKKIQQHIS